ncbi:MAG: hypothetical protein ACTHZ1_04215 [Sphingobacterium sp.]
MRATIERIVENPELHAKWLNTLSFMENCGARKISAGEDRVKTSLLQLKHAAEEHRHAYYLKKQIGKLGVTGMEHYELNQLLGGFHSQHYLQELDVFACRYLKNNLGMQASGISFGAYLLVTYAIEVRADELYPVYQDVLSQFGSSVVVKSIILEEEGHLEEMITQLQAFSPNWQQYSDAILAHEKVLFTRWFNRLALEVNDGNIATDAD